MSNRKRRFAEFTDSQIKERVQEQVPRNTRKNTLWAGRVWDSWAEERNAYRNSNSNFPYVPKLDNMLDVKDEDLKLFLIRFVVEARRGDGKEYPGDTLAQLCAGIQRHFKENGRPDLNFMDTTNVKFHDFHAALNAQRKCLMAQGVGAVRKQAEAIGEEQEKRLWDIGEMSLNTATGMSHAFFFYVCKAFGLRGCDEHASLEVDQFLFGDDEVGKYVTFIGRTNKTYNASLEQRHLRNKVVKHYQDRDNERCVYNIVCTYFRHIPPYGRVYRKPVPDTRYGIQFRHNEVVGKHKLEKYVSGMMRKAGYSGHYTNHSIRVTLATTLYQKGIDEQLIVGRTQHRSLAVREYKRTSNEQQKMISKMLDPPKEICDVKEWKGQLTPRNSNTPLLTRRSQNFDSSWNTSMPYTLTASMTSESASILTTSEQVSNRTSDMGMEVKSHRNRCELLKLTPKEEREVLDISSLSSSQFGNMIEDSYSEEREIGGGYEPSVKVGKCIGNVDKSKRVKVGEVTTQTKPVVLQVKVSDKAKNGPEKIHNKCGHTLNVGQVEISGSSSETGELLFDIDNDNNEELPNFDLNFDPLLSSDTEIDSTGLTLESRTTEENDEKIITVSLKLKYRVKNNRR